MSAISTPTLLVIIGISGDLSHRKLLPAIREIAKANMLPEKFKIVGVSRRALSVEDVLPMAGENDFLRSVLDLYEMDPSDPAHYGAFAAKLSEAEKSMGATEPVQRLFYLSVPPNVSKDIIDNLGTSGLAKVPLTKLLLEKPFGTDFASAKQLIADTDEYFDEECVYRIDHYLAKEMTQNLVIFRSGNSLFRRTWNRDFIESITITMTEQIGIEGRAAFYEQTGALRDIVQSHLLQLAALTLMELPEGEDWAEIPAKRLSALEKLKIAHDNVTESVVRGQYRSYRDEVDNQDSAVETFVSLTLASDDERWQGVPITLTTGKGLSEVSTEIKIAYRKERDGESNILILRIQPNEGVEIRLWAHQPGYDHSLRQLPLRFSYSEHYAGLPEAYERVFVDAMRGNRSLFAGGDEVLASWRILEPILANWSRSSHRDLVFYEARSRIEDVLGSN